MAMSFCLCDLNSSPFHLRFYDFAISILISHASGSHALIIAIVFVVFVVLIDTQKLGWLFSPDEPLAKRQFDKALDVSRPLPPLLFSTAIQLHIALTAYSLIRLLLLRLRLKAFNLNLLLAKCNDEFCPIFQSSFPELGYAFIAVVVVTVSDFPFQPAGS